MAQRLRYARHNYQLAVCICGLVSRSPTLPGANDNASIPVAALVMGKRMQTIDALNPLSRLPYASQRFSHEMTMICSDPKRCREMFEVDR